MRDIAVALIVFGGLPFILRKPWLGILMWTWLGFMNPHRLGWGFMTSMPVALIVALVTLAGFVSVREPKKMPWSRESVILVLFLLWATVTTAFAMYPAPAWQQWEKVMKIQLMIFVAMMLITNRERLDLLVWTIAVSIGFYGVKGGIFTIVNGGANRVFGPPGTFIEGNNEMGLALAMTIPLMYYLYTEAKKKYVRWGLLAAMFLTGLAAIGTHSRGALLGMGTMAVMLWWKSKQKFFIAFLIALSAVVVVQFMPQEWFDRMATIKTYEQDQSAKGRLDSWAWAFNLASSRILGGGFEAFSRRLDAHSIYFEVMGEHGFIGLALFLLLWAFTWMAASRMRRQAEKLEGMAWLAMLMRMTQVALAAYLATGAFLGMAYFDYPYNLVLIVVVAQRILAARHAEMASAAPVMALAPSRRRLPSGASP